MCILIGSILGAHYKLSRRDTPSEPEMLPLLEASDISAVQTLDLDQELCRWGTELCSELHERVDENPLRNHELVCVHSAVMEMVYHTAQGMVHQAQILVSHQPDSAKKAVQDFSRQTLREGARRITENADYLDGAHLLCFLPPVGVTSLLASALQHTRDVVSCDESIRVIARKALRQTLRFLVGLDELYPAGGHASRFLKLVWSKINADDTLSTGVNTSTNRLCYTSLNYTVTRIQTPRSEASMINENGIGVLDSSFASSSTPLSDNSLAVATTEPTGLTYHSDFQYDELDFESLLNLCGISDNVLPDSFDSPDFDIINWTELFQV